MGRDGTRRRRVVVGFALVTIFAIAALQTLLHVELTLGQRRLDTIFDLGRSNGVPDLVSTMTLAFASVGATALALRDHGIGRAVAAALAGFLGILTLADALHDGAHPTRPHGLLVVALAIAAVGMLLMVCRDAPWSMRSIVGASFPRTRPRLCVAGPRSLRPPLRAGARRPDPRVPDRREGGLGASGLRPRRACALARG